MIWKIVPCDLGFTKFPLDLTIFKLNTVLRTLEICHYGPVHDVSKTGLYPGGTVDLVKHTSFPIRISLKL